MNDTSRRTFLRNTGALGLLACAPALAQGASAGARPFPLSAVRLTASPWLDAVQANLRFLMSLDADRLLARFRENAGLPPRAQVYGGWESDTIAGHTLGHYLSALSLMHAQTGDAAAGERARYIVSELALCQAQSADGYVAALGRRVGGATLNNGKSLFDDVMQGRIDPRFGNLNGGWAPLYNIHKQLAGLLDAHQHLGSEQALAVARGMAGYLDHVFGALDQAQTQSVLDCEFGGLQESVAELYARTGEQRWLLLARRLRHEKTFRPLAEGRDELDQVHSNTEIPKYVGAARLYEIDGGADNAAATRFFWRTVTRTRSYVVGGNGDREWFYPRGRISRYITDQTCEHCSTYNMLKITRHLFQWQPEPAWFDYYERAHLNHTLAAQDPSTGMFAYMMPTMAGAARTWSLPADQFWCCMGSGMEAHAKHGESIYWQGGDAAAPILYINEYIPSTLDWPGVGRFELRTRFPHSERVELQVLRSDGDAALEIRLRLPGWTRDPVLTLDGRPAPAGAPGSYASVSRIWRQGERIGLTLPMRLVAEATPDDPSVHAYLHGPMVLAADLGRTGKPLPPDQGPALLAGAGVTGPRPQSRADGVAQCYTLATADGATLTLRPFYRQWRNRTALYFTSLARADWPAEAARRQRAAARRQALLDQSVDVFMPGDPASEATHGYADERTELTPYRGRSGRLIKSGGGYLEASLRCGPHPLTLYVTYWGEAERGMLGIRVDGELIATQRLNKESPGDFFEAAYPVPHQRTLGKASVRVRFEPLPDTRGPSIYGVRIA